jgi:hypothetical protein
MDFALHTLDFLPVRGEKFLETNNQIFWRGVLLGEVQEGGKPGE